MSHTRVDGLRAQAEDHQAPSTEEHGGNWSTTCLSPRLVWSVITAPRQAHENLAAPSPCPLVSVEPSPSSDKLGVRPAIERPEQHPPVRSCGFDPIQRAQRGSALALRAYCLIGFSAERRTCIVGGRPRGHNETAKPFLDHAMDWSDTARAQAAQRWRHAATPAKREWNGKEQGIPVGRNTGSIWPRVENNEGRIRSGGNHVQGLLGGRFLARRLPKRAWDRWPDLPRQIYARCRAVDLGNGAEPDTTWQIGTAECAWVASDPEASTRTASPTGREPEIIAESRLFRCASEARCNSTRIQARIQVTHLAAIALGLLISRRGNWGGMSQVDQHAGTGQGYAHAQSYTGSPTRCINAVCTGMCMK